MRQLEWKEYLNIPVANDEDLRRVESQIGIKFPTEYKQLLKLAQGKIPIPNILGCGDVSEVLFGPIFHVLLEVDPMYSLERVKKHWDEYYPNLLPVASSAGSGCFFAYDFQRKKEETPIVFIDAEADPEDEDEEGVIFVAHSLTELLDNLKEDEE
jgi:hypothetical protein